MGIGGTSIDRPPRLAGRGPSGARTVRCVSDRGTRKPPRIPGDGGVQPRATRGSTLSTQGGTGRPRRGLARRIPRIPLRTDYLAALPALTREGESVCWECTTELGDVPLELTELYPVGPYLGLREFEDRGPIATPIELSRQLSMRYSDLASRQDWSAIWNERQMMSLLTWVYGPGVAEGVQAKGLHADRSHRTGRLRGMHVGSDPAFVIGNDGVPRPTWMGARLLQPMLSPGGHRVVVGADAASFVAQGRTLFARFVEGADPSLVPGSSALLVDRDDRLLAVGRLLLSPHEMGRLRRGIVAYVTSHARQPLATIEEEGDPALPDSPGPLDSVIARNTRQVGFMPTESV